MGEQKSGIQVTLDYFSAAEVCHPFGKSLLGVAFICMVKLRGFRFKSIYLDNAAAIADSFVCKNRDKLRGGRSGLETFQTVF